MLDGVAGSIDFKIITINIVSTGCVMKNRFDIGI